MSRIHEALLRAEAERVAREQNGTSSPSDVLARSAAAATVFDAAPDPVLLAVSGRAQFAEAALDEPAYTAAKPVPDFISHNWTPDSSKMVFCEPERHPLLVEIFRTLRSKIYSERSRRHLKTLLITSAAAGDGKSFIAANLAQAIAHQSERVLLVDGDLRRSTLHDCLGAPNNLGLSEYLMGECDLQAVVQRWQTSSMHFVPSGRRTSKPTELLLSSRMAQFIEEAKLRFDWIILDSPPCTVVSDGIALAQYSDGILLVMAQGAEVDAAQQLIKELSDKPVLGTILNRTAMSQAQHLYSPYR